MFKQGVKKTDKVENYMIDENRIKADILRKRQQILVHSCLYYRFDTNLIEDYQYDRIGKSLAELQMKYPELSQEVKYKYKAFETFGQDGCYSGYNLPTSDPDVVRKAQRLIDMDISRVTKEIKKDYIKQIVHIINKGVINKK